MTAAGTREDRRVDTDEFAAHVDERPARIARVDRGIRLDEGLEVADTHLGPGERRHDALSHRLPHPERIADGNDKIPDLEPFGIAEAERRERTLLCKPKHGKIRPRVAQHDLGGELASVGERHLHLRHALDDVIVGDDETGRIDDDARAKRALHPLARHAEAAVPEEAAKEGIIEEGIGRPLLDACAVDVDDTRRRLLDDRRERELHLRPVGGHLALLRRHRPRCDEGRDESRKDKRTMHRWCLAVLP